MIYKKKILFLFPNIKKNIIITISIFLVYLKVSLAEIRRFSRDEPRLKQLFAGGGVVFFSRQRRLKRLKPIF